MTLRNWGLAGATLLSMAGPVAAQTAATPFRIGMLLDLSGPYSDL